MKIKDSVTRRRLLETTSSAILLYPLLRLFKMDEGYGADAILPRALFVHWPSGSYLSHFWPQGDSGPLGALPEVTAPLDAHKSDIILFKGLVTRGDTNHNGAPAQVLAGWGKDGGGVYKSEGQLPTPYSLDQMLGDLWGAKTSRPVVGLGAFTSAPASRQTVSFRKATGDKPVPAPLQDNPKAAFNGLFGSFTLTNGGSSALALANDNVLSGKKRLVDYLRNDIKKVKGVLGPLEGGLFESHVQSLDDIAKEIAKEEEIIKGQMPMPTVPGQTTPPSAVQCAPKAIAGQIPTDTGEWHTQTAFLPTIFKLNRQIMVQALACGVTRVGLLQFGNSDTGANFGSGGYHDLSHAGGPTFAKEQAKFMTEVAALITELKGVTVGSRTLWDEVLMLGATDIGDDPNGHDGVNVAAFFAGRLGGKIKGGRMIAYPFVARDWASPTNGMSWNRMLLTFASLVGETGITEIGSNAPSYKGILPEV